MIRDKWFTTIAVLIICPHLLGSASVIHIDYVTEENTLSIHWRLLLPRNHNHCGLYRLSYASLKYLSSTFQCSLPGKMSSMIPISWASTPSRVVGLLPARSSPETIAMWGRIMYHLSNQPLATTLPDLNHPGNSIVKKVI